jgi:hypothetical protein
MQLYDIHLRKYIIYQEGVKNNIYLVHYNGFVFGTSYLKMLTIRERETI